MPTQPLAVGVMVMVPETGALVVLLAVNEGIMVTPLAANPMEGLELVQAKVVPLTALTGVVTRVRSPWQYV